LQRKPVLPGPKGPLASPPRLWRVGRNHLNPQLAHGPPHLRKPVMVHPLPGFGRVVALGGIPDWRRPRQTPAARWSTANGLFRVPAWSSNRWE